MITQTESAARRAVQDTRKEWGEFLARYGWSYFCTLTFGDEPSPERARREFRRWIRRLDRLGWGPVSWFFGAECGAGGRWHLHALVYGEQLRPQDLRKAWTAGQSQVSLYTPMRGAAWYVTKYIAHELADYDISPRRPPLVECRVITPSVN